MSESIRKEVEEIGKNVVKLETKLDDFMMEIRTYKKDQIDPLHKRVRSLENSRTYVMGAFGVLTVGALLFKAEIKDEVKRWIGVFR